MLCAKPSIAICSILTASLLLFISSGQSAAQEWSSYRGPNGDGTAKTGAALTGKLKVHWKVPTSLGFSSFAVANGKAVTLVAEGKNEVCVALDAATGKPIWDAQLGSNRYDGGGGAGAMNNK